MEKRNAVDPQTVLDRTIPRSVVFPNMRRVPTGLYICYGAGKCSFLNPQRPNQGTLSRNMVALLEVDEDHRVRKGAKAVFVFSARYKHRTEIPIRTGHVIKVKRNSNFSVVTLSKIPPENKIDMRDVVNTPPQDELLPWDTELVFHVWVKGSKLISHDGKLA